MGEDPVLAEMFDLVRRAPEVVPVRLRLIALLIERARYAEALEQCAQALIADPRNTEVQSLMTRCTEGLAGNAGGGDTAAADHGERFDWHAAESQVADIVEPAFLDDRPPAPLEPDDSGRLDRPLLTLADVARSAAGGAFRGRDGGHDAVDMSDECHRGSEGDEHLPTVGHGYPFDSRATPTHPRNDVSLQRQSAPVPERRAAGRIPSSKWAASSRVIHRFSKQEVPQ